MFIGPLFLLFTIGGILITENLKHYSENYENHVYHYKEKEDKSTTDDEEEVALLTWEDQFLRILTLRPEIIDTSTSTEPSTTATDVNLTTFTFLETTDPSERLEYAEQKCPEGMSYFEHFLGIPFCYILTEKQTYPPTCPYENYLEYDSIKQIYDKFKENDIWVRAERNVEDGFGEFEWVEPSSRYLDIITKYEKPVGTLSGKYCMKLFNYTLIPVMCSETYPVLCVYSYKRQVIEKFCSKRNEFVGCISTNLNLDNKCYCQALTEGMTPSRETFCKKFAEPIDPFQNYMLLTQLTNKSPCWFGIEHTEDGVTRWSSTNKSVDYIYWKDEVDFSKRYGALDYNKPKGWLLQDEGTLKCAICEIEIPYQNVTLHLKYIPGTNKLEIQIYNLFDIHNYFLYHYVLVCFTDANTTGLKKRVVSSLYELLPLTESNYTKVLNIENYYPSYYWCESIQRPNLTRISSNKVLIYKDEGKHNYEYALTVKVPLLKGVDPHLENFPKKAAAYIFERLEKYVNIVRPMKITNLSENDQNMQLLLHLSSKKNNLSPEEEYQLLLDTLRELVEQKNTIISDITDFSRSEVCLPSITMSGDTALHWPETCIGKTALPRELCLLEDSLPVTRKCGGDFLHGAKWTEVKGDCVNITISERTLALHELLNSEKTSEELSCDLCAITANNDNVIPVEVHFIAEILEKLERKMEDSLNISRIANTISHVMDFDNSVLQQAQTKINSTDITLYALDKILSKTQLKQGEYFTIRSNKVLIQISDLKASNVTGIAVYKSENTKSFESYATKSLFSNMSLEDLANEDIIVAVLLSNQHVQEILKCIKTKQEEKEIKLAISFFYDDILFNEIEQKSKGDSIVVSVFIPGFNCEFKTPIPIIFKRFKNDSNLDCGHWRYGSNDAMENIYGSWKPDCVPEFTVNESTKALCKYSHTTHYALLMWNDNTVDEINPETHIALNIITAIGCGLSLLGLAGIFITAILFKSWRRRARNIIMLNFSTSLTAQTILLFVADNTREDSVGCIISGASLHYTVLSEFAWMLIVAVLQYRKFVVVFQSPISYLIVKCLVVGWCLPIAPVVIMLILFPESYHYNRFGLCYPQDEYFYFGVILPVSVIILINLFVFIKILLNVCHKKVEAYGSECNEIRLQVLLAISLFFLLGMSWLFGLAAAFFGNIVFSFVFCLTATFQGFIIFIFFVVMNEKSRLLWLNLKKFLFCTEARKRLY